MSGLAAFGNRATRSSPTAICPSSARLRDRFHQHSPRICNQCSMATWRSLHPPKGEDVLLSEARIVSEGAGTLGAAARPFPTGNFDPRTAIFRAREAYRERARAKAAAERQSAGVEAAMGLLPLKAPLPGARGNGNRAGRPRAS